MIVIKDGNFTPWFRALLWISGLVAAVLFYNFTTGRLMYWGIVISTIIAAIGAYAEKANALRLKPFDNSYQKARRTYSKSIVKKEK